MKDTKYFTSLLKWIFYVVLYRKVPNFRTLKNFAVIYLKFKQRGQTLGYFVIKHANGIANSEDPDQTAPLGVV